MSSGIPLLASDHFMRRNVAEILTVLTNIAIISILVVTVAVILIIVTLSMNDERRMRLWVRLNNVRKNRHADVSKGRNRSRSSVVDSTFLDDDVKFLHSYYRKRRQIGPDDNCDNSGTTHQHHLDIVSLEVQEWKRIQKDVKMQLTVLNKAVQQLQQKNSQSKIPDLKMAEH